MAANLEAIDALVLTKLQCTDTGLNMGNATAGASTDRNKAISGALAEYELQRPLEKVLSIDGAGVFDYAVSALTGFVDGFSQILGVIYPYVTTDQKLQALRPEEYRLQRLPAGLYLRFLEAVPSAAEDFLVYYTARHTLTLAGTSTVPASDDDLLADLATSLCCLQLANYYGQTTDGTIQADSVQRISRAAEYRANAKRFREQYEQKIGIGAEVQRGPGLAIADLDLPFSDSSAGGLLFHEGR